MHDTLYVIWSHEILHLVHLVLPDLEVVLIALDDVLEDDPHMFVPVRPGNVVLDDSLTIVQSLTCCARGRSQVRA